VADAQQPLQVELQSSSPEDALLVLAGEIDLYTSAQLRTALEHAIDGGARRVIVDLSKVDFVDSTGLAVLIEAIKRLPSPGGSLHVVCPNGHIKRVFEITGLTSVLTLHATREEAIEHGP
jgi:anti-sigma B factor antagonist